MRPFTFLQRLPLLLVGAVMLTPLAMLALKALGVELPQSQPLHGVQLKAQPPGWTWANLMASGGLSKELDEWFNEHLPEREAIVRLTNQIYFDLFGKSYMNNGTLVVGKKGQMYESIYLEKYCNTEDKSYSPADFAVWRRRLEKLTALFKARGQTVVYYISPSKAAFFPQYLPDGYRCADTHRPDYDMALAALQGSGLPYVDGSAIILGARSRYPENMLFPRGGTHYTFLGAALVSKALLAEISSVGGLHLPEYRFDFVADKYPGKHDRDLLDLANLYRPDLNFEVPLVHTQNRAEDIPHPLKLALVGGSFLGHVMEMLIDTGYFSTVDYYFYLKLDHIHYPWGSLAEKDKDSLDALFSADVVILEENEVNIPSNYLKLLEKKLVEEEARRQGMKRSYHFAPASVGGSAERFSLAGSWTIAPEDEGKQGKYYAARLGQGGGWHFLTPKGWVGYTAGPMLPLAEGKLISKTMPIYDGVDVSAYHGDRVFIGYGLDDADLFNGKYASIYSF